MSARLTVSSHRGGGFRKSCHLAERKTVVQIRENMCAIQLFVNVSAVNQVKVGGHGGSRAEAREKKEDEDLLQEELDRQRRLVQQLKKKNQKIKC